MIRAVYDQVLNAFLGVPSAKYRSCAQSEVIQTPFPLAEYKQARDPPRTDVEQVTSQRVRAAAESGFDAARHLLPDVNNGEPKKAGARRTAPQRASPSAGVGTGGPFFLTVTPSRSIARQRVLRPAAVGKASRNSASVASGRATISAANRSSC